MAEIFQTFRNIAIASPQNFIRAIKYGHHQICSAQYIEYTFCKCTLMYIFAKVSELKFEEEWGYLNMYR